ncbi:MAG TPA: UDP-N-acetylmuramoyl-L-alanyl-D-glutamate--2,6-diaminopimelate ligase [bacterium]|jgi:UDP-N-acetylmuramoyl-L-alanyl-D-glutamate--2,6-diaminopimelate ligase|nr:UDP-N-acetylmuramoyl-L-alanyl-D-glutamate--2,6-diaminopimelate ligase [bacterium]HOG38394.1 UDP-N-acetylmuramoyl-L-alanyl-D-glutamate--2,6-diaminopimelate ligase [bacterium]HQI03352.1 UDP-N-acetylmuramoyl-L-alanyl-D-glutamate--2,6-diaminopimelate ligase [bacterium]
MLKKIIKKILPRNFVDFYHKYIAILASKIYGNASNKLIVIGVTGTNGKSTTIALTSHILESCGYKTGFTSTIEFKTGDERWLNDRKMTMTGRFMLQKLLRKMVKAGCQYAIIETSSEGIKQYRHLGINYDVVVFTNLTPEHIESHGSFDNYKKAKLQLFKHLTRYGNKIINAKRQDNIMVVNRDDIYSGEFLSYDADIKIGYSINRYSEYQAKNISLKPEKFDLNGHTVTTNLVGEFNIYNVLCAIAICNSLGVPIEKCIKFVRDYTRTPGRMEFINEGQDFRVLIDYAPEVESLKNLYKAIDLFYFEKLIHVIGSCGGGRDKDRQPILGKMAGNKADIVIVTNEDPYDDDPMQIIDNVSSGAIDAGKELDKNLFKILDRRLAIRKAIELAEKDDMVLITGKGAEQFICVKNGHKISWDDRVVTREELKSRSNH